MGVFVDLRKETAGNRSPYQEMINAKFGWLAPVQGDGRLTVFEVVRQTFWEKITLAATAPVGTTEAFTNAANANNGAVGYFIEPGKLPSPMTLVVENIKLEFIANTLAADAEEVANGTTFEFTVGSNNKRSIFGSFTTFRAGQGLWMPTSTADENAQNGIPSYEAERPIDPAIIVQSAEAYRGRLNVGPAALTNVNAVTVRVILDCLQARAL